jgi:hypothetical protein
MFAKCARGIGLLSLLALSGCASDTAIFVTKSSLSIVDVDTTPPEISLAYHRIEGFIAPRNQNGDAPPVLANLKSDGTLLTPMVQQVYATGSAAETLAGHSPANNSTCSNCKESTASGSVFFTTSTSLGLRFSFSANNLVDGVVLGFRRKEVSVVPALAKDADGTYHYPSLLATIRTGVPGKQPAGDFAICQGFASGNAATALAGRILSTSTGNDLGCLGLSVKQDLLGSAATIDQATRLRPRVESLTKRISDLSDSQALALSNVMPFRNDPTIASELSKVDAQGLRFKDPDVARKVANFVMVGTTGGDAGVNEWEAVLARFD